MSSDFPPEGVNKGRRNFLLASTTAVGAAGVAVAAVPFIESWTPSAKARAVGAPVQVSVADLKPGGIKKVQWRGQTIGILRRTPEEVTDLSEVVPKLNDPDSQDSIQPEYAQNDYRSIRDEYLVVNMHCTHLGCVPSVNNKDNPPPGAEGWVGGFYCPCHKSKFDFAGRVYKGVPAPTNLTVPPYSFVDDETLVIGVDSGSVA
ncbi:MAG TPA: ubiquinol-cytochrome c reductase iron-sulfur subunit [Xanthomonadales bacterium]|nr:ubiquinol-cytochrome c reductase iron-sulfur subunit [Xanthomonadales bacterium]